MHFFIIKFTFYSIAPRSFRYVFPISLENLTKQFSLLNLLIIGWPLQNWSRKLRQLLSYFKWKHRFLLSKLLPPVSTLSLARFSPRIIPFTCKYLLRYWSVLAFAVDFSMNVATKINLQFPSNSLISLGSLVHKLHYIFHFILLFMLLITSFPSYISLHSSNMNISLNPSLYVFMVCVGNHTSKQFCYSSYPRIISPVCPLYMCF